MVLRLTELTRLLYSLLTNKANDVFFFKEQQQIVTSIAGRFHVYAYLVPEQGLRVEEIRALRSVFAKMIKDRLTGSLLWIFRKSRLAQILLFIPVSKTPPPSYIQESGFIKMSASDLNEVLQETFEIESTAMYLSM